MLTSVLVQLKSANVGGFCSFPDNELSQINSVPGIQNSEELAVLNHMPESEHYGKYNGIFSTNYSEYITSDTINLPQIQDEARRLQEQYTKDAIFLEAASQKMHRELRQKIKVLKNICKEFNCDDLLLNMFCD